MLGVASMGFGHGGFGHGSFGHGPWCTFPYTPGYVFGETTGYRVTALRFEDLTEQRYLTARVPARTLHYEFGAVSSALQADVTSWFLATGGPALRFRAIDHRTGAAYIVRLAQPLLPMQRGPAMLYTLPSFGLDVVHADSGTLP